MLFLIRKRFFETLIMSLICSAPLMILTKSGLLYPTAPVTFGVIMLSYLAFMTANVYVLHEFYMGIREKKPYFIINMVSYTLYAALSIILYYIMSSLPQDFVLSISDAANLYGSVFMPERLFQLVNYITGYSLGDSGYISMLTSVIIVHIISYVVICAVYVIDTLRHIPDQFADENFTDEQLMDMFGYVRTPEEKEEYERRKKQLEDVL